jgi:hypothetical protein
MADQTIANMVVPLLYECWKALTVMDKITTYHDDSWLSRALLCTPTTLDFPTLD